MSSSVLYMSMSLDGYIAGPDDEPGNPGGDGFMRLHEWYFADGESGRPSGPAGELTGQMTATGAVLVGRRTAEQAGHYKGDHHGAPIFVLSHRPPGSGTCWCTVLKWCSGRWRPGCWTKFRSIRSRCCSAPGAGCSASCRRGSNWRSSG